MLTGPTAIAFGNDESSTAKAVIDATRPYRVVTITGGVLGDRAISADGVRSLASLPSRDVLLAQAIGAIVGPMAQTATLLQAPMAQTARLVAAFIDARGGDDGASAPVSA
jgi:large subunit ribosomal protein L10